MANDLSHLSRAVAAETRPYKDIVLDELRRAIISGSLPAGAKLPQDKLASEFGVSRMPVREALQQLQIEGLVEFPRHRVAVVSALSPEEIAEIFDMRAIVERRAAEIGVPKLKNRDIKALEAAHQAMLRHESCSVKWLALNQRFHAVVYEASERRQMCQMIVALQANLDRYLMLYFNTQEALCKAHAEHGAILAACYERDGQRAAELIYRHIADTAQSILAHIELQRTEAWSPEAVMAGV